jgi:hypothetical protein
MKEKNKELLVKLLIHFGVFVLFTIIYITSFRTGLFQTINVFFYRGILLLLTASLFLATTLVFLKRNTKFSDYLNYYDLIVSVIVFFSFNLIFFTHVPVTADRSLSVFMLGSMTQDIDGSYRKDELENLFIEKYINENNNIGKRIDEQLSSGNIMEANNEYKLTDRGKKLMDFYKNVAEIFEIPKDNFNSRAESR